VAKYQVSYSCGHIETVNLLGPHKQRERKLEWYRSHGLCSPCWHARRQEERDRASGEAAMEAFALGFAPLEGSAKSRNTTLGIA